MITELLRQYEPWECGNDGYPLVWHKESAVGPDGARVPAAMLAAEDCRDKQLPIKDLIREQAANRCQRCGHPYAKGEHPLDEQGRSWSPCDDLCRHPRTLLDSRWRRSGREGWLPGLPTLADMDAIDETGEKIMFETLWRVLTVHHLDEDKMNCRWWNLAALCQRCHLRMQRGVVMGRPYHFEHSEWFKPYAAGFYAWKYLGEELKREEALKRLPDLLALEHRFTQEVLL